MSALTFENIPSAMELKNKSMRSNSKILKNKKINIRYLLINIKRQIIKNHKNRKL